MSVTIEFRRNISFKPHGIKITTVKLVAYLTLEVELILTTFKYK